MKKRIVLWLLCLLLLLSQISCGGESRRSQNVSQSPTVGQLLAQAEETPAPQEKSPAAAVQTPVPTAAPASAAADPSPGGDTEVDVDLTALSATMIYSQVFNMMSYPENFVGKRVRASGVMSVYEGKEQNYYACLIADATACCAQGLEFVWAGEHRYPEDYPALGTEITVTGTFELYEENGFTFCRLADAELIT